MSDFIKICHVYRTRQGSFARASEYCGRQIAGGMVELMATEALYNDDPGLRTENLWKEVKGIRYSLDLSPLEKPLTGLAKGNACHIKDKWMALMELRETASGIMGYAVPLRDKQVRFLEALFSAEHPESANLKWADTL